ncbi:MAG TPA: YciI family protein [Kofleriaceae bacterium]
MPKYVFVFRGAAVETSGMSPEEMQAHVRKWYAWADTLAARGFEPKGQPLDRRGRTIRGTDRVVTDGPYAETKDLVIGNMSLVAASLDEAVELAHGCPVLELGGSVEVRPTTDYDV